jgi:hypothetical protein
VPTQSASTALSILRDTSLFQWYIIPLLAIAVYVYAVEIEKENWKAVFAGLAFWGMDFFNEIWNALVFHFTNYAPVWGAPSKTSYLFLIGLNVEIMFMFAISGIGYTKLLPKNKNLKILGINNRLFCAILNSIFCVVVEMVLNHMGYLTWEYSWWSIRNPWLIFIIGYMPFNVVCFYVYDMKSTKSQAKFVGIQWALILLALIVFIGIGWI